MADFDNMGPSLQLIGARFLNFLLSNFAECRYYRTFKGLYCLRLGLLAGSPICIVHADMTLIQSKVKVKVTRR